MLFIRFIIITLIILIGCKSSYDGTGPNEIMGCIEETACNYNEHATVNDGSCQTVDVCGECGGDVTTIEDCALPWKWNINYNISRTVPNYFLFLLDSLGYLFWLFSFAIPLIFLARELEIPQLVKID